MANQVDPAPPAVLDEIRSLVRIRWFGGAGVIVAAAGNALGAGWSPSHTRIAAVGVAILAWNLLLTLMLRRRGTAGRAPDPWMTWSQVLPDLTALTLLSAWTGGVDSPLLLGFVLYMVLVSLVLTPVTAYSVAAVAVAMVYAAFWIGGMWPADRQSLVLLLTWTLTLLATAYLANRIARGLRTRESALRGQHRRTQAILDTAADGIITIDEAGTVQSVNPAAEAIFGYRADEIVGRNVNVLMPDPYHGEHDRYLANYLQTGRARIIGVGREVAGRRKTGEVFPVDLAVSEVKTANRRLFTGIVRDISDRKEAEARLRQLNDTLLRQQQALVQHEKLVAMGEMAAGVAHEIANPLASMDSLLQLVDRHPDRLDADTIGKLREQITRIDRLVRQMKSFAHPGDEIRRTLPVNDLVQRALDMVDLDHRTRHVGLHRDLADDAGRVHVTPQTIDQVLVNLVLNALDAVAGVDDPSITVTTRREASGSFIRVSDNGRGIPTEHLARIFEPFFTTKPIGQGTGLGLSISQSLVERDRGRIEVESLPGERTVFTVHLPGDGGEGE